MRSGIQSIHMKNLALIFAVLLIALGATSYILSTVIKKDIPEVTNTTSSSPLPTSFTVDTKDLQQGGASFADPNGIFTILYPIDYKIDQQNNGKQTRIYKMGPTQQGQTEMYDGVILVFEGVSLSGMKLDKWIDESIKNATADGTTEIIEDKKPTQYNKYPGFTYKLRGLGEFQYIVMQKDTQSDHAVVITVLIADPQNIGFQKEVDQIINTLQILK